MQLIRASHKPGPDSRSPTETFTGTVHMDPIFQASNCMGNNVCFTPGARTFWHRHENGQILTVTLGTGLICSEGEQPQKLQVGDMVHIPAGEVHWHGATKSTIMAHTAISLGSTAPSIPDSGQAMLSCDQRRRGCMKSSRKTMKTHMDDENASRARAKRPLTNSS